MEPTAEAAPPEKEIINAPDHPDRGSHVDRYLKNSYAGPKARMGETVPVIFVELPEQHLKKHEKMLKDSGFEPNEDGTRWTKLADETSRVNADRIVREINDRPLAAYEGVRR